MRALALLLSVLAIGCAASLREGVRTTREGVRFTLKEPAATSVAVAGDWNGWSVRAHPLARSGGVWTAVITLPPGEHAFMYVVDGTLWLTPRNVTETAPDGFGGWNGTIRIP